MEKKYYLVLDQGTTSTRALIYDKKFNLIDKVAIKLTQITPNQDWVEHDPIEIWNTQLSTIQQLLNKRNISISNIISIGITNQRETIVAWDKKTGNPIYNAIVWSDNRCAEDIKKYLQYKDLIFEKTGLILSPYFSVLKMRWILDNVPRANELLKQKRLAFGTIDSWLLYKLSNQKMHCTDHTNASRTMLFNINNLSWDDELLKIFDIDKECLATIKPSADFYCEIDNNIIDKLDANKTPITSLCGDQQASLFGHQCFLKNEAKATFGTGCFVLINVGNQRMDFKDRLISTLTATTKDKVAYALEGAVFNAGVVVQWLINNIKLIYHDSEIDWYANLSLNNKPLYKNDLYFIPALNGLGTPYWNPDVKGAIFGLSYNTKKEDIIKASIEGIVYQLVDIINIFNSKEGNKLTKLELDGGLTNSAFLNQFIADMLNITVQKQSNYEITSLGSCFLAAIGNNDLDIQNITKYVDVSYQPQITKETRQKLYQGWLECIKKML